MRGLIWFLALVAAIACAAAALNSEDPAKTRAKTEAMGSVVRAMLDGLHGSPYWMQVRADEVKPDSIQMTLNYAAPPPGGISAVERDTKQIARALLASLVAVGRNPSQESIYIFVWAQQPVKGETGQDLFRRYGHTYYDMNNDSLIFKPAS